MQQAARQPGILLSAKDKYDGETADMKDDYYGFDMGLQLVAGYQFNDNFGVGLSFSPGISNINQEGGSNGAIKDRNQTFSLGLQYSF